LLPQFNYEIGTVGKAVIGVWEQNKTPIEVVYEQHALNRNFQANEYRPQHNGQFPDQASRTKIVEKLLLQIKAEDWNTFKELSKSSVVDEMLKKVWEPK
jgi:hypothetical protein